MYSAFHFPLFPKAQNQFDRWKMHFQKRKIFNFADEKMQKYILQQKEKS